MAATHRLKGAGTLERTMTDDEDPADESARERAQALRDELADAVDAPAQQDEQAARRRQSAQSDSEGAGPLDGDDTEQDPADSSEG